MYGSLFVSSKKRQALKKVFAGFMMLSLNLSLGGVASILTSNVAYAAAAVVIDTINGQAPTGHCVAGPITITGHGTRGSNGGPYSVDFGWGDGSASTTIAVGSGADGAFTFSTSHTPLAASTGLTINLYHGSPSGKDTNIAIVSQCVAPPATAVVTVKKHVINNNGGVAMAPSFTLHVKQGSTDVTGSSFLGSETGKDFFLTPNTYSINENSFTGYTQTGISCVGNGATTTNGSLTTVAGKNYVCTLTNDDDVPAPVMNLLTVVPAGAGSGTVSSSPLGINCGSTCFSSYVHNTVVTLSAVAASGSTFAGWSGACTGTGTCMTTMSAARSVTATFILNTYTLSVSRGGTGLGTVTATGINCGTTCSGIYNFGSTVTLTASPTTSSTFSAWTGCDSSTGNTCTVTVSSARTVDASFALIPAPADTTPPNTTITSGPSGIVSATSASFTFTSTEAGTFTCILDAGTPTACTSPQTYSTLINGPHMLRVYATDLAGNSDATPDSRAWTVDTTAPTVTIVSPTTGQITGPTGAIHSTVSDGTVNCTLDGGPVACDASGSYSFSGLISTQHTFVVTAVDTAGNVGPATLTWTVDATGPVVTIVSPVNTSTTLPSGSIIFTTGDAVSVTCSLDSGPAFACNLTGTYTYSTLANGTHTFIVTGTDAFGNTSSASVTWTVAAPFSLNVTPAGTGSGVVTGTGITCGTDCGENYISGTVVNLTPAASTGSTFAGWSGCDTVTANICRVSMTAARSVTATFTLNTYVLSVTNSNLSLGVVTGTGINCGVSCSGSYDSGALVTLTATAGSASTFTGWSGACSGTGTCVVTMDTAKTVSASFTLTTRTLSVTTTGPGSVTSSPAGITCGATCLNIFDFGTLVTLTPTPSLFSIFVGWTGDCIGATCALSMESARSVTATFSAITENTSATCSDNVDNDGDNLIDLADPDCAAFVPAPVDVCPNITGVQTSLTECTPAPITCEAGTHLSEGVCVTDACVVSQLSLDLTSNTAVLVGSTDGSPAALVDFDSSTTGQQVHTGWTANIPGAKWIWGENPVATPEVDQNESFFDVFTVSGTPTGATLDIAADNTYEVYLNNVKVGESVGGLAGDDSNNFQSNTQDSIVITASNFITGSNTLEVRVRNIGVIGSNPQSNPAGLLYKLHVSYNTICEQPPVDVCLNQQGIQTTVPTGMTASEGICSQNPSNNGGGGGGGGSSSFDYWGCTNPAATNFNPLANKNDNSCKLPGDNNGNHQGGGNNGNGGGNGEVLGAATTTEDLPLPASCAAHPYLRDYLKLGKKNEADQVKLLQTFLNESMSANLPVSGVFGSMTKVWVKKFQKAHNGEILQPWIDAGFSPRGLKDGTGYVFKTTKRAINMIKCAEATIPMPVLTPDTN